MSVLGLTAHRYLRKEVIGRGSTATVYRAHDQVLDRPVALKEIYISNGQSVLLAEARAAASINHQNVVIIHDVIVDDSGSYIAMELLDGPVLGDVLRSSVPTPEASMRIACDIASALDAAHRRGVTHCDIKPDNIFVTESGRTVVTDFGLAVPELGGGTPGYMSPEQYTDEPAHPTMDVFAWACLVTELLCGVPPFGTDPKEAERRTCLDEPLADMRCLGQWRGLPELIARCLDPVQSRRPADGGALFAELTAVLWQSPPSTVPIARGAVEAPSAVEHLAVAATGYESSPRSAPLQVPLRLMIVPDGGDAWYFDLYPGESIEVGREATLAVPDPQVSRRHVSLFFDGDQVLVTDLGSMNGTYLNGHLLDSRYARPGDVLHLGTTSVAIGGMTEE